MVEADVSPDDFDYDSDYSDYDNDYSDYDSDYSDYGGRFRSMTRAERERYNEQIRESGGFDVDVPPDVAGIGLIRPSNFDKYPQFFEELENCSRYAIDHYNFNNTTNYLFMRPVKVCSQMVAGRNHYITFEAKATAAAAPMYFQALVYHRVWEDYIKRLPFAGVNQNVDYPKVGLMILPDSKYTTSAPPLNFSNPSENTGANWSEEGAYDLKLGKEIARCPSCSLYITVIYNLEDFIGDSTKQQKKNLEPPKLQPIAVA
ncbi:hypothetical protein Vadar_030506 [Vaccinium darrowii]|uniref:Uncharacterized protein n=1 Tax=Vaccinium darrowii TaxID=229202 RepID=A0ACB7YZF3_9ERIC|nr:hypothetical protein Vadar_030506 [Vaccinium darrowii]